MPTPRVQITSGTALADLSFKLRSSCPQACSGATVMLCVCWLHVIHPPHPSASLRLQFLPPESHQGLWGATLQGH